MLLAQASQDDGDLSLADGDLEGATAAWQEGVDALFFTLDAHERWRSLLVPDDTDADRADATVVDYSATLRVESSAGADSDDEVAPAGAGVVK